MRAFTRVLVFLLAALALPTAFGAPTVRAAFEDLNAPRADGATPAPARVSHDPAKPTAVVVVGEHGAVVSDTLAPFEVLATTGAFNVYAVAPSGRPAPLTGGLDLVPDLTFAGLADLLGGAAPDVVVVPAMPDVGQSTSEPVTDWLTRQAAGGSLLLSVCNGAGVLASAGLLDGRRATALDSDTLLVALLSIVPLLILLASFAERKAMATSRAAPRRSGGRRLTALMRKDPWEWRKGETEGRVTSGFSGRSRLLIGMARGRLEGS